MNEGYSIRQATLKDVHFLADSIMFAEKSNTDKLGLSTLFNLTEEEVKENLVSMLEEEVDGCEFSVSSFLVADHNQQPVATVGAWIEEWNDEQPSKILKANLIAFTFPAASMNAIKANADIIKDIQIEREKNTMQIEYVYVHPQHRGQNLVQSLITKHIENSLRKFPEMKKCQVQLFANNGAAAKVYQKMDFAFAKKYTSHNQEILNFLPYNEKDVMELMIKK